MVASVRFPENGMIYSARTAHTRQGMGARIGEVGAAGGRGRGQGRTGMLKEAAPTNRFEALWAATGGEDPAAPATDRALAALAILSRTGLDPQEKILALLQNLLEVTRAERIFFFDASGRQAGEPAVL